MGSPPGERQTGVHRCVPMRIPGLYSGDIATIIEKWGTFQFDGQQVIQTEVYDHERSVETFLTLEDGERCHLVFQVKQERG
jgi:hypothetical protein